MNDYPNEVSALQPVLLRIARRHVANPAWAEDAVSETLLAALEQPRPAPPQASLQAWMVSILRHKLVDQIRRNTRELPLDDDDDDDSPVYPSAAARRAAMAAGAVLPVQADPLDLLARKQLVQLLASCLDQLPERQTRAVVLRDWLGHETSEVCRELGMNANNLFVTLHRARNALRAALALPQHGAITCAAAVTP